MDASFPEESRTGIDHSEAIVRLFAQHQRWLHGYLTALLGSAADAEDVFQEVCVIMWREHHKYALGTSFASWLSVIAYHQVQKFRREQKRSPRYLGDTLLDYLAEEIPKRADLLEARRKALGDCVAKLRDADRDLVRLCYAERKTTAKQVAERTGRPANTVYKALHRIRKSLHECVNRTISAERLA